MRLSRPLAALGAVALLGTGALSGCGLSDIQAAPGVAAEVHGTQISVEEVDQLSRIEQAVALVALLELGKSGEARIGQSAHLDPITVWGGQR